MTTAVFDQRHHIAGADVAGDLVLEHRNPADPDDAMFRLPIASRGQVDEAARASRGMVDVLPVEARADFLEATAQAILRDTEALAVLMARETGKTLADGRAEAGRAARIFRFFAGEALRNIGERFDSTRTGSKVEVIPEPVGVVGAITPWNFPVAIPAWKIAPALAYGCSVLWKPSEVASATASALMGLLVEAGLPAGMVSMLLGDGGVGAAIAAHPDVDAVTFTGSQAVGDSVRAVAAARGAAVQLEMGGVNGLVVAADADLDAAVTIVINGAFFAAGQRCTATSRIIVDRQVADQFQEKLLERARRLVVGDPRDPATEVGPLASLRQKAVVAAGVSRVISAHGAPALGEDLPGAFFAPTLFLDLPADSEFGRAEIFGPVAGLYRANGFEAAIRMLNDTPFGLSAGLCTRSMALAEAFKRRARAGMCMINLPTAGVDYHAPFGGVAASSYGPREQGRAAQAFYTRTKTIYQFAGALP